MYPDLLEGKFSSTLGAVVMIGELITFSGDQRCCHNFFTEILTGGPDLAHS
jgi:hypothetical protein